MTKVGSPLVASVVIFAAVACSNGSDPDPRPASRGQVTHWHCSDQDEANGNDCTEQADDAPFQAPATLTPIAGWRADAGLTTYVSTPTEHSRATLVERYNWQSKYLDMETWDLDNDSHIVQSKRCIVEYKTSQRQVCYPMTVGNYALEKYSKYVAKTADANAARGRFMDAANWFRDRQDARGGWPFEQEEVWWAERAATLQPGWYSAMAQGLGISVMVRAFYLTGDERYLDSARRAVGVLRTSVLDGGVMRRVGGHVFYEEYPTTPMSNVLNGYLFSVIGLYDLSRVAQEPIYVDYFNEAVRTVHALISHYDLGSYSAYDLSHLQHPGAAPNRARWSYHSLHVTQLSWLLAVTKDDAFFGPLVDRWAGYLRDQSVPEN